MILAEATAAEGWTAITIAVIAAAAAVSSTVVSVIGTRRTDRKLARNGGTTNTVGDATVRLEAGQSNLERRLDHLRKVMMEMAEDQRAAVKRDDGRFVRVERAIDTLRDRYDREHPGGGAQ